MFFKKEESKTIMASCLIFLLIKVAVNTQVSLPNTAAALMTIFMVLMLNLGGLMPWTKAMAIIPGIIIIIIELIIEIVPGISVAALMPTIMGALIIWLVLMFAFRAMDVYWERCYPHKPRVDRMKKAFFAGTAIVLAVMLIVFFSF